MPLAPRRLSSFPLGLWLLASALAACGQAQGPQAALPGGPAPVAGALAAISPAPAGADETAASPSASSSPSASPSASPVPGALTGEWVAFTSNRGVGLMPKADFDVFLFHPATDTVVGVPGVNTPGDELDASLTSDGRWLSYVSNGVYGDFDVFLYDVPRRMRLNLPGVNTRADEAETWFDDEAKQIVFTRQEGPLARLLLYDRPSNQVFRLPALDRLETSILDPHISPDGRLIAFAANVNGHDTDLFVYRFATRTLEQPPFVNTQANEEAPVFDDDGQRMVFLSDRIGRGRGDRMSDFDVFLVDLRTGLIDNLPLANSASNAETPYFFQDGIVSIILDAAGNGRYVHYYLKTGVLDIWPVMHQVGASDL
ncbi:translocation protein TolB [compost metagenome]